MTARRTSSTPTPTPKPPICRLISGDSLEVLPRLAAAGERYHACVTDPPYYLASIQKRFGGATAKPLRSNMQPPGPHTPKQYQRLARGFLHKQWDSDVAMHPEIWRAIYDCLHPGAYLAAFAGTRGWFRIASAIDQAGFEVRDTLAWLYGSGFPKTRNPAADLRRLGETDVAKQWDGWSTALKPAFELIILAQKPFAGSIAGNLRKHGCGALNIDACRPESGNWPANVLHDGSPEVEAEFARYGPVARFFYSAKADKDDRDEGRTSHPTVKPTDLIRWLVQLITPPSGTVLDPFAGTGSTLLAAHQLGIRSLGIEADSVYVKEARLKIAAGMGLRADLQVG